MSKTVVETVSCISALYSLFGHPAVELRQQEIVVELVDAFDVGKYPRHDLVRKHVMLAIGQYHLEMKHLNETNGN